MPSGITLWYCRQLAIVIVVPAGGSVWCSVIFIHWSISLQWVLCAQTNDGINASTSEIARVRRSLLIALPSVALKRVTCPPQTQSRRSTAG